MSSSAEGSDVVKNNDSSGIRGSREASQGKQGRGDSPNSGSRQGTTRNENTPRAGGKSKSHVYLILATTFSSLVSVVVVGLLVFGNPFDRKLNEELSKVSPSPPETTVADKKITSPESETVTADPVKPVPADPAKPEVVKTDPPKPEIASENPVKSKPADGASGGRNGSGKSGGIFGGLNPRAPRLPPVSVATSPKPGGIFGNPRNGRLPPATTSNVGKNNSGSIFGNTKSTGGTSKTNLGPKGPSNVLITNPVGTGKPPGVFTPGNVTKVPRPPIVRNGGQWNGGFVNRGGVLVPGVVDPGTGIFLIGPSNFLDGGFVTTFSSTPLQPIAPQNLPTWLDLLATSMLEVLNRSNVNVSTGASGPLVASPQSLNGLTFVQKGLFGATTGRMTFTDTTFRQDIPTPVRSGSYAMTSMRISMLPDIPAGAPRTSMAFGKFRMNASGRRSIEFDNRRWEEENAVISGQPAAPKTLVASNKTLAGKAFVFETASHRVRLKFNSDDSFEFIDAPIPPGSPPKAIKPVKGKFLTTATSVAFTPDSGNAFSGAVGNLWPVANFLQGADGTHSIQLRSEIFKEELPPAGKAAGPIPVSVATLGGLTFTSTSGTVTQRLELSSHGSVVYKIIDGSTDCSFAGTYSVTKTELSLTFPPANTPLPGTLRPIWLHQNYQMNTDGMKSIEIRNMDTTPVVPKTGFTITAPADFQVWVERK